MTDSESSKDAKKKSLKTVLFVECGISVDDDIKKLYKKYGNTMMIIEHNQIDSIVDQIKEMTNLIESKTELFCIVTGDNHENINEDILGLLSMVTKLVWYISESNIKDTIKYMDKHTSQLEKKSLFIFDDLMRIVKIYE